MYETNIGKPICTRAVPQFTAGVVKPLTQIEPGNIGHHSTSLKSMIVHVQADTVMQNNGPGKSALTPL